MELEPEHTATECSSLQQSVTVCNSLQQSATVCKYQDGLFKCLHGAEFDMLAIDEDE